MYSVNFRVEHIPKGVKKNHRQQKHQIKYLKNTRKWFNNKWVRLYWIDWFMLKGNSLLDYPNLFSSKYDKNNITKVLSITKNLFYK